MLEIFTNPKKHEFAVLCQRPVFNFGQLNEDVLRIFDKVKANGDVAIRELTNEFDKVDISDSNFKMPDNVPLDKTLPNDLKDAIKSAYSNIDTFHLAQKKQDLEIETIPEVKCMQKSIPIERVGIYIPGGSAPLFSTVLMLAIPARIAGCKEVLLCTPPDKNGSLHPAILYCAKLCGVTEIRLIGGAQAIAAMCLGTESIKPVNKIFGPGNQYVTAAKQMAQNFGVSIDMPAGPSEVLVYADETCIPDFVASDLLAQAEHGPDSQVILVAPYVEIVSAVQTSIETQISVLPRKEIVLQCLQNSKAIIMEDNKNAFDFINQYAPEHLIIASENPDQFIPMIYNAGSVFLGNYTPESAGDYASGTNHTLPTNGWAASCSGVNLDMFTKKITYQQITYKGILGLGNTIITMAEAEHLMAHANAVKIRLSNIKNEKA